MRRGHLIIIFVIIFFGALSVLGVRQYKYKLAKEERVCLEDALMKASDVAANCLADGLLTDAANTLSKVSAAFFTSFSENLYWYPDEERSMETSLYVPLLVVTSQDGFYLCMLERTTDDIEGSVLVRRWTECYPYAYEDDNYIYRLYLDGRVRTVSKLDGTIVSTSYDEVRNSMSLTAYYSGSLVFTTEETRDEVFRSAVACSIEERVSAALAEETYIAGLHGINVSYTCPSFLSILGENVESSLMVIYQGMPGVIGDDYFFSGVKAAAFIQKKELYYVNEPQGTDYYRLAHKKTCSERSADSVGPIERERAVKEYGCYGCPLCIGEDEGFGPPP